MWPVSPNTQTAGEQVKLQVDSCAEEGCIIKVCKCQNIYSTIQPPNRRGLEIAVCNKVCIFCSFIKACISLEFHRCLAFFKIQDSDLSSLFFSLEPVHKPSREMNQ